ncbi:lipase [Leptolyngbya sp. BL0902]|uniref:GDSL-type esterase/lipase family protein n=1 Tax=Leptolyngbya sp. BL0902 TaxID=1115757 RepID=UPI0018E7E5BD|nr:GDSL-type esterase/lipase family protein [Leptolyngbya sp. BL0902]QQE64777.1 lipase [Leptolyngbya sp. BL0902]
MLATPSPVVPSQPHPTPPGRLAHPQKVVVVGDSLVYGYGDPEGGGWVERLRRRAMAPGSEGAVFYNLGVRGDRASQVRERLAHEFRYRGEIRNRLPDRLVISVGTNDSARVGRPLGRNYTDFDEFEQTLADLLAEARQLCPVLFVGMVPVNEAAMPFSEVLYYSQREQWRYKEATRLTCESHNIPYLDVMDLWLHRGPDWWQARLSADGLHPNVLGYQSLVQDVVAWDAFQAAVEVPTA